MKHITKEFLEDWLMKQPDKRKFNFTDNTECLIACAYREIYPEEEINAGGFDVEIGKETIPFEDWLQNFSFALAAIVGPFRGYDALKILRQPMKILRQPPELV